MRDAFRDDTPPRLLKVCGADFELGNFILGLNDAGCSGREASRALLAAIKGLPRRELYRYSGPPATGSPWFTADGNAAAVAVPLFFQRQRPAPGLGTQIPRGKRRLRLHRPRPSGVVHSGSDECVGPRRSHARHAAHCPPRACVRPTRSSPKAERSRCSSTIQDGQGNSYGSHLNFLITRRAWENIFSRKYHYLQYLASFQVSSLVYTGQGKVGAENGAPDTPFQLSQRADFFEKLSSSAHDISARHRQFARRGPVWSVELRFAARRSCPPALHFLRQHTCARIVSAQGRRHADRPGDAGGGTLRPQSHT